MGVTRNAKQARKELKALGITENDPKYTPRMVPIRFKTVAVPQNIGMGLTSTIKDLKPQTRFFQMPIMEKVNPYRRLLKAMMAGTYSERLRLEVEALVTKESPSEPQIF